MYKEGGGFRWSQRLEKGENIFLKYLHCAVLYSNKLMGRLDNSMRDVGWCLVRAEWNPDNTTGVTDNAGRRSFDSPDAAGALFDSIWSVQLHTLNIQRAPHSQSASSSSSQTNSCRPGITSWTGISSCFLYNNKHKWCQHTQEMLEVNRWI